MACLHVLQPDTVLSSRAISFWAAMAGMLCGSTLVFLVGVIGSKIFRKPAMGFGDVKLMGLLGGFTGAGGVVAGFFIACLAGSVVGVFLLLKYKSRYLPFGPFLALGCLSMILWPEVFYRFIAWYVSFFG